MNLDRFEDLAASPFVERFCPGEFRRLASVYLFRPPGTLEDVKLTVFETLTGTFFCISSHYPQGPNAAGPYRPSHVGGDSALEAVSNLLSAWGLQYAGTHPDNVTWHEQIYGSAAPRSAALSLVNAWTVKAADPQEARRVTGYRPFYKLLVQEFSSSGRELKALVFDGSSGTFIGPCASAAFSQADWFKDRDNHRFVLEGSGLWRISNVLDVETAIEGKALKSAALFLGFDRSSPA